MKLTDSLWINKWSIEPFERKISRHDERAKQFGIGRLGCPMEPKSSLWCASLSEAMGPYFGEKMILTDFGCGKGRYCNFLTGHLYDFQYYGLEPSNGYGPKNIVEARRLLGADERWEFGRLGSILEIEALEFSRVILLGSVFTHLPMEGFREIMDSLLLSTKVGIIVFSIFLGEKYALDRPGIYGKGTYWRVFYEEAYLKQYFRDFRIRAKKVQEFQASKTDLHHIYRVEINRG